MAQDFKRTDRIAEQMQRDLAELIRNSLKDPRVGMITKFSMVQQDFCEQSWVV